MPSTEAQNRPLAVQAVLGGIFGGESRDSAYHHGSWGP